MPFTLMLPIESRLDDGIGPYLHWSAPLSISTPVFRVVVTGEPLTVKVRRRCPSSATLFTVPVGMPGKSLPLRKGQQALTADQQSCFQSESEAPKPIQQVQCSRGVLLCLLAAGFRPAI